MMLTLKSENFVVLNMNVGIDSLKKDEIPCVTNNKKINKSLIWVFAVMYFFHCSN